jgi:V/A-type H+-transporting ATPase subunit D
MAGIAVPPGRAGRLWLRRRLETAARGVELLERELTALRRLHDDAAEAATRTGAEWRRLATSARDAQLRAELAVGPRGLRIGLPEPLARVEISWTTTMGVRYPTDARCTVAPPDPRAVDCSAAVALARTAHAAALEAAVRHAAATTAAQILAAQVDMTGQRVRALRRRWVPQLTDALRRREIELEEQEREDRIAARRATNSQHR